MNGARPPHDWDQEPGRFERGWQHEALSRVERQHREVNLFPNFPRQAELWFDRKLVQAVGGFSPLPCALASSSAIASSSDGVLACVTAHLMLLAITAQRAHVLGFLAKGDAQWRVWRQGFVGKLASGLPPTSLCETSIWTCTTLETV